MRLHAIDHGPVHSAFQTGTVPVRVGVPFAQGQGESLASIHVVDADGSRPTVQRSPLAFWPDGSVRWCLLEFASDSLTSLSVVTDPTILDDVPSPSCEPVISLPVAGDSMDDGTSIRLAHRDLGTHASLEIKMTHENREFRAVVPSAKTIDSGPVRWAQQWELSFESGEHRSPLLANLIANSYAHDSVVTFELVVQNPQAMDHPGGNWDLGSEGSIVIDDLSVHFSFPEGERGTDLSLELGDVDTTITAQKQLSIFQASSGGENWNSSNHVDRNGSVPLEFRGYKVVADDELHSGLRAEPVLRCHNAAVQYSVAYRDFWQNFPSALSSDGNRLRVGLFPAEAKGGHELQGGEQKTFQFAFEMKSVDAPSTIVAVLNPPLIRLSPEDYARAGALPYLMPRSDRSDPRYESLVDLAIEGEDTFAIKNEKIDQFGWRHFGDLYGDHEAVDHRGESPMISHYNNQYDCTLGFAIQFLRSGDERWFELMTQMADHAWDIDTYHTEDDKLLYNGGLFWHTYHYADAHTATHRSYPKRLRISQSFDGGQDLEELGETGEKLAKNYAIGGGPAASHNYSTGWMVAYYLTGTQRYRTAAINAADYVMRIDDGRKTPFKWLSRGDTGYSTCSADGYYGPGRAAANSTHALLTGHELTGETKYLDRAALLMRRTVHPNQNLEKLDLLNAELRWFYTMYLQALGRFVDYKDSLGQRDDDFQYGVATLLHYANWMSEHERPTLSRPDELQYPNETWAAQDMRKWHVLQHAAQYEGEAKKRERIQAKAGFFYDDVCDSLSTFKTRSLCRPVVLMLNFGWQRDWFRRHSDHTRLDSPLSKDFGEPQMFVPQRQIAIGRFKKLVVAGVAVFSLIVIVAVVLLVS
ncbi:RIFT barrel domain-containing protein [Novipirellula galeiformis]|uniref:RIFT barrel domain-containing protein n=1 Tax=Novipirellula galeiformis TaxID=2528004 RepID=UPI0011B3C2CD|nr:hypothetical protein [Novipirellula galeiformis]